MKYSFCLAKDVDLSGQEALQRIDEFLKEHWGFAHFSIAVDGRDIADGDALLQRFAQSAAATFTFIAFLLDDDFIALRDGGYNLTPGNSELFGFSLTQDRIEIDFYDRFSDDRRRRQFEHIVERFGLALQTPPPLVRTQARSERLTCVMYRYRRGEGKVGFAFCPARGDDMWFDDGAPFLFIYSSDFAYLAPYIFSIFPRELPDEEQFDVTGYNTVSRSEWLGIIDAMAARARTDERLDAFIDYVIDWLKRQLADYDYVNIHGNQ